MTFDSTGEQDLRAEHVSRIVKGFALQEYKMKQLCMIQSSSAWTETYFTETAADLTAGGNITVDYLDDNRRKSLQILVNLTAMRFRIEDTETKTPVSLVASTKSGASVRGRPVISARWLQTISA